jgi:hypothetical protein
MGIESAEEFRRLRLSGDPEEYGRAAHEEAPIEVWREVCTRWPELRKWVVQNKTVPIDVLRELSTDEDSEVRDWVARKRKLPVDIQLRMARDPNPGVRGALAYNAKLDDEVREVLLVDPEQFVREAAATRRGTG